MDNVQELAAANAEFAKANTELDEENARLREELKAAGPTIIMLQKRLEAMEQQIGQDGTARFEDDELIKVATSTLDDPAMMAKVSTLAFMEEPVMVEIQEVSEDQADPGFPIFVNGQVELFRRGERKVVKRKFVEGLARAKKTGYRNQLVVDPITREQTYEYPSKTGLRYPFSVVEDKNPRGADWLKAVLRQS